VGLGAVRGVCGTGCVRKCYWNTGGRGIAKKGRLRGKTKRGRPTARTLSKKYRRSIRLEVLREGDEDKCSLGKKTETIIAYGKARPSATQACGTKASAKAKRALDSIVWREAKDDSRRGEKKALTGF